MQATMHAIDARLVDELEPAAATNFRLAAGEPTDAWRAVAEPAWSLYCLDLAAEEALFLDIGDGVDLARAAFVQATQFRLARRALKVPFAALDSLAATIAAPPRIAFVFNIGSCGTTLVNAMLNEVDGVWSLSEPDFGFDLVLHRASLDPARTRHLLANGVRLMFRPPAARSSDTFAIKLRSQELFHAGRYHEAFPEAACVFIYRDGEGWARSFWHMLANFGLPPALDPEARRYLWWILSANSDPRSLAGIVDMDADTVYPEELLAATWALHLAEYRRLLAAGVPFLAIRYNELDADRAIVAEALLHHCSLPVSAVPAALRAFGRDSQAGTSIARDRRQAGFGDAALARFRATLARCPGAAPSDAQLPDIHAPDR